MNRTTSIGLAVLMACIGLNSAAAQSMGSTYSSTAPKDCRQIGKPSELDGSTTRVCPGRDGLVVLIAEDDLREVVSVGRNRKVAAEEPAAKVWFAPFNSSETTVEWRTAGTKPFAIIQRWHIADGSDPDKQGRPNTKAMLVVTGCRRARSATSLMSMPSPTPPPMSWPARPRTSSPAASLAARTR